MMLNSMLQSQYTDTHESWHPKIQLPTKIPPAFMPLIWPVSWTMMEVLFISVPFKVIQVALWTLPPPSQEPLILDIFYGKNTSATSLKAGGAKPLGPMNSTLRIARSICETVINTRRQYGLSIVRLHKLRMESRPFFAIDAVQLWFTPALSMEEQAQWHVIVFEDHVKVSPRCLDRITYQLCFKLRYSNSNASL